MTERVLPENIPKLVDTAWGLAHEPLVSGITPDWRRKVDDWLLDLAASNVKDQIRVVAQLRSMGEPGERGIAPLREGALAQLQARQAEQIAGATERLGRIGIAVAVVGVILAVVQAGMAFSAL